MKKKNKKTASTNKWTRLDKTYTFEQSNGLDFIVTKGMYDNHARYGVRWSNWPKSALVIPPQFNALVRLALFFCKKS